MTLSFYKHLLVVSNIQCYICNVFKYMSSPRGMVVATSLAITGSGDFEN